MQEFINLFIRFRTAHKFYANGTEAERGRILEALEKSFANLRAFGKDESFGVLLVLYGDEFTKYEFGLTMDQMIKELEDEVKE